MCELYISLREPYSIAILTGSIFAQDFKGYWILNTGLNFYSCPLFLAVKEITLAYRDNGAVIEI